MNLIYALFLMFIIITLTILIMENMIVPSVINYQHGLFNSKDFAIGKSKIQGLGLFSKRKRVKNERLFVAIGSNKTVTKIGSKINHCPGKFKNPAEAAYAILPNTFLATVDQNTGEWWVVAARDINAGEELTIDYNNTPEFISKPDAKWRCDL